MKNPQFYSSIERIISQRGQSNLNKFKLHAHYTDRTKSQVNNCIRNAIIHNVQEVDFDLSHDPDVIFCNGWFVLPEFFFTSSSFIHLTLCGCLFEHAHVVNWENLRTLHIEDGELDQDEIKNILTGCPLLETLELACYCDLERIDIPNKNVKNLVLFGISDSYHMDMVEINAPYILSLAFKRYLLVRDLVLLNVSSVIKAELDYSQCKPPKEMHEEMLKGLILSLGHVKEVKIGEGCLQALTGLKAKGFIFPSNLKVLQEIDSN